VPAEVLHWLARGEGSIPRGDGWLRPPEQERLARMRFTKRRTEYLVRRLAGKAAVAAILGLPDDEETLSRIGVLNHPSGAPYVTVDDEATGLELSLTDRAGWAVCVVGRTPQPLGVDVEIVEPRTPAFVADYLTADEQATVAACATAGPDGHAAAANLIWSAKESALKVLRVGLRANTRTVDVRLADPLRVTQLEPPAWSSLEVVTQVGTMTGHWQRLGVFLLTVVASPGEPLAAPVLLPGSDPLATAEPRHSWMERPLSDPAH
jgi:4'-phosphopantetheinyl transferase